MRVYSPRCTVIIPTYNRMRLLGRTLDSLARQTLPREMFEVIVVDDGSSDGTPAVVRSFQHRLELRYFFQSDEGFRVARARNTGIVHARGDICVFVDSGVLLHSGCLRAHLACHDSTPDPAAICGYVYGFNLNNEDAGPLTAAINAGGPDATIADLARSNSFPDLREQLYARYTDDLQHLPAPWLLYWTCNSSARTGQLRRVGMFDEAFRQWGGEDLDLGYRLHRDGARFRVSREASAIHHPHEKNHAHNRKSAQDNYHYMARKYGTPITRLLTEVPEIGFGRLNEVILQRRLPSCVDYLAARAEVAR